jgi:hypothetical protein
VLRDGETGRLLAEEDEEKFARELGELAGDPGRRRAMAEAARAAALEYSLERCAGRVIGLYEGLVGRDPRQRAEDDGVWGKVGRMLETEWDLWKAWFEAASRALNDSH